MTFGRKYLHALVLFIVITTVSCGEQGAGPVPTAAGTVFSKAPYLICTGTNTEIKVLWQLATGGTATLSWGREPTTSEGTAKVTESGTDHRFAWTITGLTPGTRYHYRVSSSAGEAAAGSFTTPPAADAAAVKFFVYGDTRSNPGDHDAVTTEMIRTYERDPAFRTMALVTGDLVSDGGSEASWFSELFNPSYASLLKFQEEIPRQTAIGNHEGDGSLFVKYFPYPFVSGRYWSFDYGPAHIVVADQYRNGAGFIDPEELAWMTSDLDRTAKPWKIILLHEPGWSAGSHGNNPDVQQKVQPLAKRHGALVVTGHNHYYSRAVVDGVNHVTTGGGGAPLYAPDPRQPGIVAAEKANHFCTVEIGGNVLTFKAIRKDGTVIDTFTMTR